MDNEIRMGETVSASSLYCCDSTNEGHRIDAILWQDSKTGLWEYQNGNDHGLIDQADEESPALIQHTIRLPHGNVIAIVDLGPGMNATDSGGASFPEIYARLLELDAACPCDGSFAKKQ